MGQKIRKKNKKVKMVKTQLELQFKNDSIKLQESDTLTSKLMKKCDDDMLRIWLEEF